jgi:hypothetical protein
MKFAITSWVIVFMITAYVLNNVSNSIHKTNKPILGAVKYEQYQKERQERHKKRQEERKRAIYAG